MERRLAALPWYCRKCGRFHDASVRIPQCKNALCREKDFTLKFTELPWEIALTMFDRAFLARGQISPD